MMRISQMIALGILGGGGNPYITRTRSVYGASLIGYWPISEASGTTIKDASGNNRTGTASNVTLAQTGIGDGNTAGLFTPASSSWIDVQSSGLTAALSGAAGTISAWMKVNAAGDWTDGAARYVIAFQVDANNILFLGKYSVNTQLRFTRKAGGSQSNVIANSTSPTIWTHVAMTWDTGANQFIAYVDGAQFGTTQTCPGTYTGTTVYTEIGRQGAIGYWSGYLAHVAIGNRALSAAEIASLADKSSFSGPPSIPSNAGVAMGVLGLTYSA